METAGIVVGAVSLASLFSTCVECFNFVSAARTHGRDFEILLTKLDVEKTRFLQWGQGVGLFNLDTPIQHRSLTKQPQQQTITGVLNCIKLLLIDAEKLRKKYGIDKTCQRDSDTSLAAVEIISSSRLQLFKERYSQFCKRIALQQRETSTLAKTKWAIRDRDGATALVKDIRDLVNNLYELAPISPDFERLMVHEDVSALSADMVHLRLLDEACSGREDYWSETASMQVQVSEMATQDRRDVSEWLQDARTNVTEEEPESQVQEGKSSMISGNKNQPKGFVCRRVSGKNTYFCPPVPENQRFDQEDRKALVSNHSHTEIGGVSRSKLMKRGISSERTAGSFKDCFEQELIQDGIFPTGHKSLFNGFTSVKPRNLEEIKRVIGRNRPSHLMSQLSMGVYERFKELNESDPGDFARFILSLITTDIDPHSFVVAVRFSSNPFSNNLLTHQPDLCYGAKSELIDQDLLEVLSDFIRPSKTRRCPMVPNCFLEFGGSWLPAPVMKRNACYHGALGARGIWHLQTYGKHDPLYADENAYTFSSTLCNGTLKIYATHPVISSNTSHSIQYHMTRLGTWTLTDSLEDFQSGFNTFGRIVTYAEELRIGIVEKANETWRLRHHP